MGVNSGLTVDKFCLVRSDGSVWSCSDPSTSSPGKVELMDKIPQDTVYPLGHVRDDPYPQTQGVLLDWSAPVPAEFFLQKNGYSHSMVMINGAQFHITGGHAGKATD